MFLRGTRDLIRFSALPVVLVAFQSLSLAAMFNAAADFSSVNNPAGNGWSYGYYTIGSPFALLPVLRHISNGFDSWEPSTTSQFPDVQKYINAGAFVGGSGALCPAGCLQGSSGGSDLAVVRWTNNTADLYAQVTATYTGFYDGSTSLGDRTQTGYILLNNVIWLNNSFANVGTGHGTITLSGTVLLSPGETIDFGMANGRIVLDAAISTFSIPEPATFWLIPLGAAAMAFRSCFQRRLSMH